MSHDVIEVVRRVGEAAAAARRRHRAVLEGRARRAAAGPAVPGSAGTASATRARCARRAPPTRSGWRLGPRDASTRTRSSARTGDAAVPATSCRTWSRWSSSTEGPRMMGNVTGCDADDVQHRDAGRGVLRARRRRRRRPVLAAGFELGRTGHRITHQGAESGATVAMVPPFLSARRRRWRTYPPVELGAPGTGAV